MIAESLRGGYIGCGVEEHRSGTIRDEAQAGTGDPTAINNSPMVSYRNADLELSKTGFRGDKDSKSSCRTISISRSTTFFQEKDSGCWSLTVMTHAQTRMKPPTLGPQGAGAG